MKLFKKSEWFELPTPIGEPDYNWEYDYSYCIERIQKEDGTVTWYGLTTNWVKNTDGIWTRLGEDGNVKPLEVYYNEDGTIDGYYYPEQRNIWVPCDEPIYEQHYKRLWI